MFYVLKVETSFTKEIDEDSFETDMLIGSNYQPHIDYLVKIDADYWWHPERREALAIPTMKEAQAVVAAYRRHQGDLRSLIKVVPAARRDP